jgi:hypothetical protein
MSYYYQTPLQGKDPELWRLAQKRAALKGISLPILWLTFFCGAYGFLPVLKRIGPAYSGRFGQHSGGELELFFIIWALI